MPQKASNRQKKQKKKNVPKPKDYRNVSVPMAKGVISNRSQPVIRTIRDGLRIKHRELLTTATQSTNFAWKVYNYPINPGLPGTFPWLSGVSRMFEQYIIHSLSVHYTSIAPTTYAGSVVMCIDYDPRDAEYNLGLSRVLMMQNASATSGPVWSNNSLVAKPASLMGGTSRKFVRVYDVDPINSTSVRSSDCGDFIYGIHTDDYTGTSMDRTYGDMWIEYDVTLLNPQPNMNPPQYSQTFNPVNLGGPVNVQDAFPDNRDPNYKSVVKQTGGLVGSQGYSSSGIGNLKKYWHLIDMVPGAYYNIAANVAEAASGVSDTIQFLTGDSMWDGLNIEASPVNRLTNTTGGTNVGVRGLFKAIADRGTLVLGLDTASGGASQISGSQLLITPTPDLHDSWI